MILSDAYNYINVTGQAAAASKMRSTVIANNIANVDTPNYKRQDVKFESLLAAQMSGGGSLDSKIASMDLARLNAQVYTDNANLSYRSDGNNVDISTESSYYAQSQLKYNTLVDYMNRGFSAIKIAMGK
ncbi:flagellar basal-body rod protein FlgB [Anaerosporobacter mobilis DSM 15930]|jgi:flagellar basal-body rod protein FlgB|uniref:Flagellar basal body rod protein FlgB n=1 Tax=Anaerosporobacter mobilis DSM 15930 TaxID=1120996 RepID=A0A1M7EYB9_9FIRM|nr:flagellar basal body rod protein FlgB [Anaerosporobacter mobilis]SHL96782.1 flagellar basal-body rod protein FlgB [Anaerosporobacter mobilis DSM 15930]